MPSTAARLAGSRFPSYRMALLLGAAAAILLSACATNGVMAPEGDSAPVSATRRADVLEITNPGDEPLGYAVLEAEFAKVALIAACADPGPECRRLLARGSVSVPYSKIEGYRAGAAAALVHTWRVVPDGRGGYEVADARSTRVGL